MGSASEMVDLIKAIIRDEESKKDQVITGTILSRDGPDDTYSVYVETDLSPNGQRAVMRRIPNESKHIYQPGDHVYILKVKGQIAQGFIIGAIGAMGTSVNAKVIDDSRRIDELTANVAPAMALVTPTMTVEPFRYLPERSDGGIFGIRLKWGGPVLPTSNVRILTDLTIGGTRYGNGALMISTMPQNNSTRPTESNLMRVSWAVTVFSGSTVAKIPIVRASVSPSNDEQVVELAFMNGGDPIPYDSVTVNDNGIILGMTTGYSAMGSGYYFKV